MSAISAVSTSSGATSTSDITLQNFLQVLMTQLTYQDPLKPMDNEQFMAQIAQFTALGQTQQVNTNVQTLAQNQAVSQSVGLLGKTVSFSSNNGPAKGTVTAIDMSGTSPQLTITPTGSTAITGVSLSQITAVQ
ncbi:flagellar hook capping protein [Herbaspirillum rubrisubalbicans]|uniref:flagellar hook capping FlgD N-terminal domain-containing protein n=1 Tax=Herbaspirillum rubrisubalbicans TaxID=80842 RepID=UPI000DC5B031|nr:flagellar hook capping FlgD N-terminal domain-containing protein [Herbaspirillum rubrisubalbicans]RAN48426.1 flagellar hook capping protein [Herbaspirillum rubrisubalbicans]